jgi:GR25 family glycosyltransferase involved in LPS biosynthesis
MKIFARYINLRERQERRKTMEHFKPHQFRIERFEAMKLERKEEAISLVSIRARADMLGRLRMHHESINTVGAVSCFLSHTTVLQQFLESEEELALVLEDDLQVKDAQRLGSMVEEMWACRDTWDIAFLGWQKRMIINGGKPVLFPSTSSPFYGAHAYMVTRRAATLLLQKAFPIEMQYDMYMQALADQMGLRVRATKQPPLLQTPSFIQVHFLYVLYALLSQLLFI